MTNEKQQEKLIAKFKMPLYQITLEMAQLIINDNLRHTLTEKEIRRLYMTFFDNENIYLHIMDAVIEAAEDAINNTDGRWDEYDKTSKDDFAFQYKPEHMKKIIRRAKNKESSIIKRFLLQQSEAHSIAVKRGIKATKERKKLSTWHVK